MRTQAVVAPKPAGVTPPTAYQIDEGGSCDDTDTGAQQRDALWAVQFQGTVQPDGIETFTAYPNQVQMYHGPSGLIRGRWRNGLTNP